MCFIFIVYSMQNIVFDNMHLQVSMKFTYKNVIYILNQEYCFE